MLVHTSWQLSLAICELFWLLNVVVSIQVVNVI